MGRRWNLDPVRNVGQQAPGCSAVRGQDALGIRPGRVHRHGGTDCTGKLADDRAGGVAGARQEERRQQAHVPGNARAVMCPECGSQKISVRRYDYGVCPETGYRDVGEYFECNACGAEGDTSEIACVRNAYS
jgi:rubredoxin